MTGVLVKVCGLTRQRDVRHAAACGAGAVGFVFAQSPRQVTAEVAAELSASTPPGVQRVALFMNQPAAFVASMLDAVEIDLIQFHGDEDNDYCAGFSLPFIKAVSMSESTVGDRASDFPGASGILLDSHAPGGAGGTGQTFDWARRVECSLPLWVAGGLNPDNVADAVRTLKPYAVDVSSGVESAPGIKCDDQVRRFIENAKTGS